MFEASRRAERDPNIEAAHVLVETDIAGNVLAVLVSVGFAAMIGAVAIHSFRTRLLPAWLAWVSAVTAVGLLTPYHYIFMLVALVWVVAGSVLLVRRRGSIEPGQ